MYVFYGRTRSSAAHSSHHRRGGEGSLCSVRDLRACVIQPWRSRLHVAVATTTARGCSHHSFSFPPALHCRTPFNDTHTGHCTDIVLVLPILLHLPPPSSILVCGDGETTLLRGLIMHRAKCREKQGEKEQEASERKNKHMRGGEAVKNVPSSAALKVS